MEASLESARVLPQAPTLPSNSALPVWSGVGDETAPGQTYVARSYKQAKHLSPGPSDVKTRRPCPRENSYRVTNGRYEQRQHHHRRGSWQWPKTEYEYERDARRLYRLYLTCPGYQQYRNRQPKNQKKRVGQAVWPDELEHAFFRALARFPPVGRTKKSAEDDYGRPFGKLMGRNEIIADYIHRITGVWRLRKQVSSHIQVLAGYAAGNQLLLSYLVSPGSKRNKGGRAQAPTAADYSPRPAAVSGLSMSVGLPPQTDAMPEDGSADMLQLHEFEMFVRQLLDGDVPGPILHSYTQSSTHSHTATRNLTTDYYLAAYPEFATTQFFGSSHNNFVAVEASLALPVTTKFPKKPELGIYFALRGPVMPCGTSIRAHTTFFINGQPDASLSGTGKVTPSGVAAHEGHGIYLLPFCSMSWATLLHRLGGAAQHAEDLVNRPLEQHEAAAARSVAISAIKMSVADEMRNLTAVQEVVASFEDGMQHKTLLSIHWSFKQAAQKEPGHLTWYNIIVPQADQLLQEDEDDDVALGMQHFESTFNFDGAIDDLGEQYFQPELQSPIQFSSASQVDWPAAAGDEMTFVNSTQIDERANEFDFSGGHINIAYGQASPTTLELRLKSSAAELDDSTIAEATLMQHFSQQWDNGEEMFARINGMPYSDTQIGDAYLTPPTTADTDTFPHHTEFAQPQALSGAHALIKQEAMHSVATHSCYDCVALPYCICAEGDLKQSHGFAD